MIELSKQVGDLAKRIMVRERYYLKQRGDHPDYATTTEDIGDELADIMLCLVRIADLYGIDLEESLLRARRNELLSLGENPDF
jgi:NTP pyrophosphatase (non-canonical NTP hydrolase)